MAAPVRIINLGHARDELRQHFALATGLEAMDHRPLGSDPSRVEPAIRERCLEQMERCRAEAHWIIAAMIGGSRIMVWKERPDGGLEPAGSKWAKEQFDAPGIASGSLYFDKEEWNALLPELKGSASQAYLKGPIVAAAIQSGNGGIVESQRYDVALTDLRNGPWLRLSKAVRILHRILKTRLAGQEPAPWIDPPADPFDADCANAAPRHRSTARTSLTMRRALLSGELTVHLVSEGRSIPLPGWAWESASAAGNAFTFNWLPLNPLLDHGLHEFRDWRCFVSRTEFKTWIAHPVVARLGDLPTLPVPFDRASQPDEISYLEPPGRPFVELTHALTWIAFAVSLSREEFSFMEECRFGPFAQGGWPDALRAAMANFADQASGGHIRVRGRYVARYSDRSAAAQANTEYLSDTQLRDFACFDSLYGGLERGAGLVWESDVLERALEGRGDGWRGVEVCRAELLDAFPPRETNSKPNVYVANAPEPPTHRARGTGDFSISRRTKTDHVERTPSVKAGRPPRDEVILAKADEMKARGLDGRTIAKEMRLEPGFENVVTTAVRNLIKGRWRPAGRPKKAA